MSVFLEHDAHSGASYLRILDAPVARSIHVTDLVMVDVEDSGQPVGVEFTMGTHAATPEDMRELFRAFPALEKVLLQAGERLAAVTLSSGSAIRVGSVSEVRIDPLVAEEHVIPTRDVSSLTLVP